MDSAKEDESRATRIKEAAKKIFVDKGYDGTTMQAIADASKVNKALLHYYFESKDKLFLLIFREEMGALVASMSALWTEGEKPLSRRLEEWIDEQVAFLARAPQLHLFIITEMTRNPELIKELLTEFIPPPGLMGDVDDRKRSVSGPKGEPELPVLVQLACTVYSLIFFPAVAAPMIQHLLGIHTALRDELLASQVRLAKDLVRRQLGEG
jgi:TetR/AcrR family transcriptional regulator